MAMKYDLDMSMLFYVLKLPLHLLVYVRWVCKLKKKCVGLIQLLKYTRTLWHSWLAMWADSNRPGSFKLKPRQSAVIPAPLTKY